MLFVCVLVICGLPRGLLQFKLPFSKCLSIVPLFFPGSNFLSLFPSLHFCLFLMSPWVTVCSRFCFSLSLNSGIIIQAFLCNIVTHDNFFFFARQQEFDECQPTCNNTGAVSTTLSYCLFKLCFCSAFTPEGHIVICGCAFSTVHQLVGVFLSLGTGQVLHSGLCNVSSLRTAACCCLKW